MEVSRADVLDALADRSCPNPPQTTSIRELAAALDADCQIVRRHMGRLVACGVVRRDADGGVRVTRVGAEVAAMDVDDIVVVEESGEQ